MANEQAVMATELILVSGSYSAHRVTLEVTYPDVEKPTWAQFALFVRARNAGQNAMACINDFQYVPDGEERQSLASIKESAMDWAGKALVPDERRMEMAAEWLPPRRIYGVTQ